MDFAYASPLDRTQILLRDLNDVLLRTGAVDVAIPDGSGLPPDQQTGVGVRVIERLPSGPIPTWDLFELVASTTECTPRNYYTELRSYLYDPVLTVVNETIVCEQIPIDDLLAAKNGELDAYANTVYFSAFEHVAGPFSFWASSSQLALHRRAAYNGYLATRIADGLTAAVQAGIDDGGGTNSEVAAFWAALRPIVDAPVVADRYWTRDIKVFLYDQATLQRVVDTATQNQWTGLDESEGTFGWQVANAAGRVQDDIDAAYASGVWQDLADIDVQAASYNWPPHFTGPFAAGSTTLGAMQARLRS